MNKRTGVSRRNFLKTAGVAATSAALVACGGAPAPQTPAANGAATSVAATAAPAATAAAEVAPTGTVAEVVTAAAAPPVNIAGKVVMWSAGDNGTVKDWATDPILQAVEAATGVGLEVVKVNPDTYQDQVNAAIASGQAPDIICVINHGNSTLISQWVRDEVVASFDGDLAGNTNSHSEHSS